MTDAVVLNSASITAAERRFALASEDSPPPLSEPTIVPCLYVTGAAVEVADSCVRVVGWVTLPHLGGETDERRIVIRFAMMDGTARDFAELLRKSLARGGH